MTPTHYAGRVQPIDLIDAHDLNFNRGNVIKYVTRAGKKDDELSDLKKALYYLQREIAKHEPTTDHQSRIPEALQGHRPLSPCQSPD